MDSIAIIGAGLAGLAAARQLQLAGREVQVFEKNPALGGRLSHSTAAWGDFDPGAQYFTARDPRFIAQVETWRHRSLVALWPVTPRVWRDGQLHSSADREQRWVGLPQMHHLALDLAQEIPIALRTRIVALSREQGQWWLYDAKGQHYGPHAGLILAVPAPQATHLIPLVSPLRQQLQQVAMGACWSLAFGFQQHLSGPKLRSDEDVGIFCQHPMLRWVARDSHKPQRSTELDTWVLHCQADWSSRYWNLPQAQLVRQGQQALAQVLGVAVPAPHFSSCHHWRYAQNHAAQQQANDAAESLPRRNNSASAIDDLWRLAACGDWQYGGRVEGAYLSGIEVATRILRQWS